MKKQRFNKINTSWQNIAKTYSENVGEKGMYFHEHVILPNLIDILNIDATSSILDLGCGEGILSRAVNGYKSYIGLDISRGLIEEAKKKNKNPNASFEVMDVSRDLKIEKNDFTHCTIVLSLQNIEKPLEVIRNAYNHLVNGGQFVMVINHPYFRIPKSTSWEIDKETDHQYRKIFRYQSPHKIRIDMNPGEDVGKEFTYSYHNSLSDYTQMLSHIGFSIEYIDEWISDKVSVGKFAESENFARKEFPMFMCIVCKKK
ncbi:class I SAM-dependent methyltransferase [Candidatus Dojkabacteria bacterium]|nr:class I SAM-dependent methyltransferase [Candidatus Dojkabacteria bacterium]